MPRSRSWLLALGGADALVPLQSQLLAALDEAAMAVTLDGTVLYWNRAAERLYGYRATDALGRNAADLIAPEGKWDPSFSSALAALEQGGSWSGEVTARRRSGELFPIQVTNTAVYDEAGTFAAILGISRDLSEQRASEDALRLTEARYRGMVEGYQEGIWVLDRDGRTTFANERMAEIVGRSVAELAGLSLLDVASEASRDTVAALVRGTPDGLGMHEVALVSRDGRETLARIVANALTDDAGARVGVLATVSDVTEEARRRTELAESEELFRRVFDESPVGIVVANPDLRVRRVNAALCTLLGYAPGELVGRPLIELVHPDHVAATRESSSRLFSGEAQSLQCDRRYLRKDGSVVEVRLTASTVRDADESVLYVVGVLEDVTEKTHAFRLVAEQRRRLELALAAASATTWEVDLADGRLTLSDNWADVFGMRPPETVEDLAALIDPADRTLMDAGAGPVEGLFAEDFRLVRPSGDVVWAHGRGTLLTGTDGLPPRMLGVGLNVTDAKVAEQRTREAAQVFRTVIETSEDAFLGIDRQGRVTDWNSAAERMFGYPTAEALGRPVADLIAPEDRMHALVADPAAVLGTARFTRRALTARNRAGESFPVEVSVTSVTERGELGFKAFVRDTTERHRFEEQLARRHVIDPLTALPNRTLLMDRLTGALARLARHPGLVAVVAIDLDRFKVINDSLGHGAGDRVLATLGRRLPAALRATDTLARFGGGEFVVLCEDLATEADVTTVADRLLQALRTPMAVDDHEVVLQASLGIAIATAPGEAADLVRDADAAMHRAKERGGGRYELFDQQLRARALARLELEAELRQGLERGELEVYYQPVVDRDERPTGIEALVRWNHPTRGLVPPLDFIPLAEETGLIAPLGEFVLAQACRQAAAWRRTVPGLTDLTVAVNLSPRQLNRPDFVKQVEQALAAEELDPTALCLEITESVLADDPALADESLAALHALGVRLAVDDFGTGYSSLLSLRRFPVQLLKLDRSFVAGLGDNAADTAIVGSIIQLARSLGVRSLAEGVERREQLEALRELGCDLAQGYYWSRPLPPRQLEEWLRQHAGQDANLPPYLHGAGDRAAGAGDRDISGREL